MNMSTTILGGGAIFGTITILWGKIRWFLERIASIIIVNYDVQNEDIVRAVYLYLTTHYKLLKFQPKTIMGFYTYVKPQKNYLTVAYELNMNRSFYFKGTKFLIFGYSGEERTGRITTLRGLLDIKQLIIDALEEHNDYFISCKQKLNNYNRFYIDYFYGTGGKRNRNLNNNNSSDKLSPGEATSQEAVPPSHSGLMDYKNLMSGKIKFLRWNIGDIGEENKKQKSLNNLALPDYITSIVEEAQRWYDSKDWFLEKDIPWRRGWLLYGKPGTGKSSLVKGIGQFLDIPIYVFDLSSMSNLELNQCWEKMTSRTPCIALIEDIDTIFSKRVNKLGEMGGGLTFDCLLNCISGVKNTNGIFTIITSNNVEEVDPALGALRNDNHVNGTFMSTRPGRIDRIFELPLLDEKCRRKIANRILVDCPSFIEQTIKDGDGDTGAQFQERCSQIALKEFWKNK